MQVKHVRWILIILIGTFATLFTVTTQNAQAETCMIPDSGPWPPCATGATTSTTDCIIPPSGPWPPCATSGSASTPSTSNSNDCVIPASGPWPPCATGGSNTPTANVPPCVIPTDGPWPPCATGGSSLPSATAIREQVLLVEVLNGHTIIVDMGGGYLESVQLIGITAPQVGEPCGAEAAGQLANKIGISWIELERDVTDRNQYGQLARYVYYQDRLINGEMVGEGYAKAQAVPPNVSHAGEFYTLQQDAQANQQGCLWERMSPYTNP